jgi:hypothetical protein
VTRPPSRHAGAVGTRDRARQTYESLPEPVRAELRTSAHRLASVRTPKDMLKVLEAEVGRLSQVVVPVLAEHPLPVRTRRSASTLAGVSAGLAAAFAELDELAIVLTDGIAAPTAAGAATGLLAAFVVEVWASVSLRVHQVQADGREVDVEVLADEVTAAILGTDVVFVRQLAGRAAAALGKRIARRWASVLIPGAGVAIEGWAAARTIRAIAALPLDSHPLRAEV